MKRLKKRALKVCARYAECVSKNPDMISFSLSLFRMRIALGTVHMLSLILDNLILLIHPQLIRLEIWLSTYFI